MAYVSPGGAFSEGLEGFMLEQKALEHQALMDKLSIARDQREQLRVKLELEDSDRERVKGRIAAMQPGDIPDPDLQVKAKKYGLPLPTMTPAAAAQNVEGGAATGAAAIGPQGVKATPITPGEQPGAYKGTPTQQFGAALEAGKMQGPSQVLGGAIRAGVPSSMFSSLERLEQQQMKPQMPRTSGLKSISNEEFSDLPAEQRVDFQGNKIPDGMKADSWQPGILPDGRVGYSPGAPMKPTSKERFWLDTSRSQAWHLNEQTGEWEPWNKAFPQNMDLEKAPNPPTSQFKVTDQGLVEVTPTRGQTTAPPGAKKTSAAAGTIRPPVMTPAPPAPPVGGGPQTTLTPGAITPPAPPQTGAKSRAVLGPNGEPLHGPQGGELTEAGAAPFAVMLASGVSPTKLMSMGMAGSMRTKVANLAGEYRTGLKPIPPDLANIVSQVADAETTFKTLSFLQRQGKTAETSARIAKDNLRLAEEAGEKVARTDAMFINRLANKALKESGIPVTGSTDVGQLSDFETKIYTAIREYAKVASGSSASVAGLSEGATHEATALLNSAQSPEAFKAAVQAMEADMDNIIKNWNASYEDTKNKLDRNSGVVSITEDDMKAWRERKAKK